MDSPRLDELIGAGFTEDATNSKAPEGRYYTDPELHRFEVQQVFHHEWVYFCHQTQVPNPGDYLVGQIGDEPVYVMRGQAGELRAFYNVCQHRGHELLQGQGTVTNAIVCPYHAWSYDMSGALKGAPKMRQVENFCKADVQLAAVRLETVGGFVFVNLDEHAASLRAMAPDFEPIITSMIAEADQLVLVKERRYDINANWKVVVENFLEAYHVDFSGPAHQALGTIIDVDTYRTRISGRTIEYTAAGGHPDDLPYESNHEEAFTNSKGAPFHQVFLYPHTTFSVFPGTNMLFVYSMSPNGPDRCAEQIHYFGLDASISEPSSTAEAYVSEQLNHDDIALVESVFRGLQSKGYRPGRMMVDREQQASWSEQFVHHFNQLNISALRRSHH